MGHAIGVLICVELASRTEVKSEGLLRRNSSKIGSKGFAANELFRQTTRLRLGPNPSRQQLFLGLRNRFGQGSIRTGFDVVESRSQFLPPNKRSF